MFEKKELFQWKIPILILTGILVLSGGIYIGVKSRDNIKETTAFKTEEINKEQDNNRSTKDTIQAIADTIQMSGLGMEASTMVAEQTMMLANVAEMTQEAASKGVVTMLSAFNLDPLKEVPLVIDGATKSVNQMVDAMDKINYVG